MNLTATAGPTCPHCAQRPRIKINDYVSPTCASSECQEASYRESAARNRRRRRSK